MENMCRTSVIGARRRTARRFFKSISRIKNSTIIGITISPYDSSGYRGTTLLDFLFRTELFPSLDSRFDHLSEIALNSPAHSRKTFTSSGSKWLPDSEAMISTAFSCGKAFLYNRSVTKAS